MAEPPGAQPALGIDAVEWLATGEGMVTVIVTGRWRRRAAWRGRPVLVIESQGRRYRFPAIAEPPSVAGATPGTWRMTFTIPAWLAPQLGGHCWLQFGGVVVPLPGVVAPATPPVPPGGPEPAPASEPEGPAGEPSWQDLGLPPEPEPEPESGAEAESASEPEGPAGRGPDDLLAAAEALRGRIQQLERERRAAEQRAHEEEARRSELEQQQAGLQPQLTAAQERVRELERQLTESRASPWRGGLAEEIAVARRLPPATAPAPVLEEAAAGIARAQLSSERAVLAAADPRRVAELERELRDHMIRAERLYDVIEELRGLLDGIRGVDDADLVEDAGTGGRVEPARLDEALARLREAIPPQPPDGEEEVAPTAETETAPAGAKSAAAPHAILSSAAPTTASEPVLPVTVPEPPAVATRKSWLLRALRVLAKEDAALAGRVILGLLPAERLAYAEPVAYDLLLADAGCFQVTARGAATRVSPTITPRALSEVDFRLTGELETLARLLLAGRLRRRIGRRMATLHGSRKSLSALTSLVRTPLGLAELYSAGMRLEPPVAFRFLAAAIDRKAAASYRFTIAHRGPAESWYLRFCGADRPVVSDSPPLGPVATTIVCEPSSLVGVIAGDEQAAAIIRGSSEPLELIRDWLLRAKSG